MKKSSVFLLFTITLIISNIKISYAQEPIYPWKGSFYLPTQNYKAEDALLNTGKEWVDLSSGNLMIFESLIHYPGRNGLDLDILLTYNSGYWRSEMDMIPYYGEAPDITQSWCGLGWDLYMGEIQISRVYCSSHNHYQDDYTRSSISIPSAGISSRVIKGKRIGESISYYQIENHPDWKITGDDAYRIVCAPNGTRYHFNRYLKRQGFWNNQMQRHEIYIWVYFLTSIEDNNGNLITIQYANPNQNGNIGTEDMDGQHGSTATYSAGRLLQIINDTKSTYVRFHYHVQHFHGYWYPDSIDCYTPILDSIIYTGFNQDGVGAMCAVVFYQSIKTLSITFNADARHCQKFLFLNYLRFRTHNGHFLQPDKYFRYEYDYGNLVRIIYPTANYDNNNVTAGYKDIGYNLVTSPGWSNYGQPMDYRRVSYVRDKYWPDSSHVIEYYYGNDQEGNVGWDNNEITQSTAAVYRTIMGLSPAATYRKTKARYTRSGDFDIYYFIDKDNIADFEYRVSLWKTCSKIVRYNSAGVVHDSSVYGYDLSKEGQIIYDNSMPALPWAYLQLRGELYCKGNIKTFSRYDEYTKYNQWKKKTEYGFISNLNWGQYNSNPTISDIGNDRRILKRGFLWESNSNYVSGNTFIIDPIIVDSVKDYNNIAAEIKHYEYDTPGYNDYYNYYNLYPNYPPSQHNQQGQCRGNLTKYKYGLKESDNWSWITIQYKYDCCGNMVRKISPLGDETAYRYDFSFPPYHGINELPNSYRYAHLKKIAHYTNNDSICEGARWYKDQGLLSIYFEPNSEQNENGWCYRYERRNLLKSITAPFEDKPANWSKYFMYDWAQNSSPPGYNCVSVWTAINDDPANPQQYYQKQDYLTDFLGRLFQYQRMQSYTPNGDSAWNINYFYTEKGLKAAVSKQFSDYRYSVDAPRICWGPMDNGYTEFKYDAIDRTKEITYPPGTDENDRIHYTYTDNIVTLTNENDDQRRFTYDGYGRISKVEQMIGNNQYTTQYFYDALGNLTQISVNSGAFTITYVYDSMNRLRQKNNPNTGTTKYVYDDANNLRFIQDANHAASGDWIYMKYDDLNRLTEEGEIFDVNPGRVDANNQNYPTTGSWRLKRFYDYSYNNSINPKGNLVRELISQDGNSCIRMAVYSYDKRNRLINKTVYKDDNANAGMKVSYEYDAQDNLIKIVYPDSEEVNYNLNWLMFCDTVYTAGNNFLACVRYEENERIDRIQTTGYNIEYDYYSRDWMKKIILNGTYLWSYGDYDNVGNLYAMAGDGYGVIYGYDNLYRLKHEDYSGNINKHISYNYDYLGNRTQKIEDGVSSSYGYTPNTCRLIEHNGSIVKNDARGNIISLRNYDNSYNYRNELLYRESNLAQNTDGPTDFYSYQYDGNGNRFKMTNNLTRRYFVCDQQGRILYETDETPNLLKNPSFENGNNFTPWLTYTPSGTCTWMIVSDITKGGKFTIRGTSKTDAYESFIQKMEYADCPAPFVMSLYVKTQELVNGIRLAVDFYNASGTFLANKSSNSVSGTNDWLQVILPISSSDIPAGTARMDIFVRKVPGTGTCWIDCFRVEAGTSPSPNDCKYIYMNGLHLAKIDAMGNQYFYLCDAQGTPIKIMDKDGYIVKSETFKAFGEQLTSLGSFTNTHRYTGKEYDNSGIYYYGARYYDPVVGRFLNPDPLDKFEKENPATLNPYAYCINNPLRYIDPTGKARTCTENGMMYVYRLTPVGAALEGIACFFPGVSLAICLRRAAGHDITLETYDWISASLDLLPVAGKVIGGATGEVVGDVLTNGEGTYGFLAGIEEAMNDRKMFRDLKNEGVKRLEQFPGHNQLPNYPLTEEWLIIGKERTDEYYRNLDLYDSKVDFFKKQHKEKHKVKPNYEDPHHYVY